MSSKPKHILFITSSRIGDAVLSTGVLKYLYDEYPKARFTIACGPLAAPLFAGFPNLERLIPIKKEKYNMHWVKFWREVVGRRYDVVVDLRNSAVSRLIWARKRHIHGRHIDKTCHKVAQNSDVLDLTYPSDPHLWFTEKQMAEAKGYIPEGRPVLGVGPSANWAGKTWPADRFMKVIEWITGEHSILPNARVAVFAAPGEEYVAKRVLSSIPADSQIDLIAKTDPGTAAACLSRCHLYLGNDSGLMHCAAAVGTPTFGLFGPSYPHIYKPWGAHTGFAGTPETFDQLIDFEGYDPKTVGSLMESLTVEHVISEIQKSWPQMMASSLKMDNVQNI